MDRKSNHLVLFYITNRPDVAIIAEKYGVDRIWIDLERLGKEERQKQMNTVKSQHSISDISAIKPLLTKAELMVRINPWNENSPQEIESVIEAGSDVIMLPYWKSIQEVRSFIQNVNGRCKTSLLLETKEAVECVDEVLSNGGFDEIHIGLNDLHLSYGLTFMFELLTNGVVEELCDKFKKTGIPYGFGGIAKLGEGLLPAEKIIMEHYRLGSTRTILSRTFCNYTQIEKIDDIERVFKDNMENLRNLSGKYGSSFYLLESEKFEENYKELTASFKKYYPKFNIAYSYKTNYIPKLVQIVNRLGGFAEIVSDMELEIALKAGVKAEHIIWNGPIKNMLKVKELLLAGGTVNIDSIYEYEKIKVIAEEYGDCILNIGIRCNYDVGDGVLSRFGFDVGGNDFEMVLREIAVSKNMKLINLQAHFAKRSPKYWQARTMGMLKIYEKVLKKYGLKPERLDIGGGIYGKMPDSLRMQLGVDNISYHDYASQSAKLFADYFEGQTDSPYLFIEPGSAIAGDCMRFVSKVETIKQVRGKTIVTALGSQKNISMTGINPPMEIIDGGGESRYSRFYLY